MKLIPLPAFQDNYLWLLHDGQATRTGRVNGSGIAARNLAPHCLQVSLSQL